MITADRLPLDFAAINKAVVDNGGLGRLFPGRGRVSKEVVGLNPGTRRRLGKLRLNRYTGHWLDDATDKKGDGAISLVAHLANVREDEAAIFLVQTLGLELGGDDASP